MTAKNKRIGAQFELDTLAYLRNEGFDAERLRLAGRFDEGDLVLKLGGVPFVLELKNEKTPDRAGALREAEVESKNYARARGIPPVHYAVVRKARNKGIGEAVVEVPLHEWLRQVAAPF